MAQARDPSTQPRNTAHDPHRPRPPPAAPNAAAEAPAG
jgi:hypothetical protein